MASTVDGLHLRRVMGKDQWLAPIPWGPDGWVLRARDGTAHVLVSVAGWPDDPGVQWIHASMAREGQVPSYEDLKRLHRAVFGPDAYAYQVFAPVVDHINVHDNVLHLWGRVDGARVTPDFGAEGTI